MSDEYVIRLTDKDRQLLRMVAPSIEQRAREPNDAWAQAAAIIWLLIDSNDPVGFVRDTSSAK